MKGPPMDRRNPSIGVRRCAGKILMRLAEGEASTLELCAYTVCEQRTVNRALDHIRTWDIGLVCEILRLILRSQAVTGPSDDEIFLRILTARAFVSFFMSILMRAR